MRSNISRLFSFLVMVGLLVAGCGKEPTQIDPEESFFEGPQSSQPLFERAEVLVLSRLAPLDSSITVTRAIGKSGGSIKIPDAGLKVVFPSGSVKLPAGSKTVDITVKAVAGSDVAYEFGPSGLVFQEPVKIEQDLKVTNVYKNSELLKLLEGVYFQSRSGDGTASVSEFRPTYVDVTNRRAKFYIDHFSGYLLAVGRE